MKTMTWDEANEYISKLNSNNYLGHNDWRLPTVQELVSLFDYDKGNCILPNQANSYWSASTYACSTYFAWFVYMSNGYVYNGNKTYCYYVWPVRGGQVKTDVDRITANDDGTYTDNQTGLVWGGGGDGT